MARRIARDAIIQITFGGPDDGNPEWGASPVVLTGIARSITVQQTGETVDLAGIGDAYARVRFAGGARQRVTIESFLPNNDFGYYQSGASPIGYYARVEVKPASSLGSFRSYEGIIREWQWSTEAGDRQVERIEIEGPLDL